MLSLKCAVCGSKKSQFMKKQEAKGILSSLAIQTALSNTPSLFLLFEFSECNFFNAVMI